MTEPETGLPYRLRILGCEAQGIHPEMILLEDLSRTFENAEEKLSQMSLKMALNYTPCRECQSHLSGWLMSGKLLRVELQYVQAPGDNSVHDYGDRFGAKGINAERFKSFIADTDWSQMYGGASSPGGGRQGTFTKDDVLQGSPLVRSVSGKSPRSSLAPGSRIPTRSAPGGTSTPNGCLSRSDILETSSLCSSMDFRADSGNLRDLLAGLSASLQNALSNDTSLRSSLLSMESGLQQIQSSLE
eukprot:TRINITY_DN6733_c0_g1_i1.p1 TRINITY_DN6733_c0_g1~~TRINITY_DN6733_c0_g1_i1.p1  ORF type:complete len:244 (-),score=68.25 TRINITY_DN6733_c0_g1_i1:118-849(-)